MSKKVPFANGDNGRDPQGRFTVGNRGGPGNPLNQRVQLLRNELLRSVEAKDVHDVAKALLKKAKSGDVPAARELLDRILGRPSQSLALTDADGEPLQLQALTSVLLEALAPFPQARQAVAAKLLELDK